MYVSDLKIKDIIFAAPFEVDESYASVSQLEIYQIAEIRKSNQLDDVYVINFDTIIGVPYFNLYLPAFMEIDELSLVYHDPFCLWIYTRNEEKIVKYYQDYIDGKNLPKFDEIWNENIYTWMKNEEV